MGKYFDNDKLDELNKPCYKQTIRSERNVMGKLKRAILDDLLTYYEGKMGKYHKYTVIFPGNTSKTYIIEVKE